jgi:hypothetical protein
MLRVLEERVGVEKLAGRLKAAGSMSGMVNDAEVDGDGWPGLMPATGQGSAVHAYRRRQQDAE